MKKFIISTKKGIALVLSFALVFSLLVAFNTTDAKKKAFVKSLKVSKSSVTIDAGKSVSVKATVKTSGSAKKAVSAKANSAAVEVKTGKTSKKGVTVITLTGKAVGAGFVTVKTKGKNKKGKFVSKKIAVVVNPSVPVVNNNGTGSTVNNGTGNTNFWSTQPTSVPVGLSTPRPTEEPDDWNYDIDCDVSYGRTTKHVAFKINKDVVTEEELIEAGYTVENGVASKDTVCDTATYTFTSLPNTLSEIKQLPLDKEFGPMAATICALATAQVDKYNMQNITGCPTYDILDYLNGASRGPDGGDSTKSFDQQFLASNTFPNLRNGYQLCFFDGALPTNEYTPDKPLTFTIYVGPYYIKSKTMLDGTLRPETHMVLIKFGGDDSERYIDVYKSSKDDNWYSYQDQWKHMGASFKPIQKVL